MMPLLKTIVIGCVDPRVESSDVLGIALGEAAVLRNVGGRVTPPLVQELTMLRKVTQAAGGDLGPGWELIVLHHTDCGITRLEGSPDLLAAFFDVETERLRAKAINDPRAAVAVDVAALKADPSLPGGIGGSGYRGSRAPRPRSDAHGSQCDPLGSARRSSRTTGELGYLLLAATSER
jgi:carbonic anhydrase